MFAQAALIAVLTVAACHRDEPLEKLAPVEPVRTFQASQPLQPPPPPPPPAERARPAPPAIAALVRDRFGAPGVTLYTFAADGEPAFLDRAVRRVVPLAPAHAAHVVGRLAADDAFGDGMNGCTCGGVGVRIARGEEHVDFIVDCGNVYLEGGAQVGTLADDVVDYIDARL